MGLKCFRPILSPVSVILTSESGSIRCKSKEHLALIEAFQEEGNAFKEAKKALDILLLEYKIEDTEHGLK